MCGSAWAFEYVLVTVCVCANVCAMFACVLLTALYVSVVSAKVFLCAFSVCFLFVFE